MLVVNHSCQGVSHTAETAIPARHRAEPGKLVPGPSPSFINKFDGQRWD